MSDAPEPTPPVVAPATTPEAPPTAPEPIWTAELIVTLYLITIAAGAVAGVFMVHDMSPIQAGIAGSTVSGILGGAGGYWWGSSKGGQTKDATLAKIATQQSAPAAPEKPPVQQPGAGAAG